MTNPDSIFKSRDITLPTKIHLVKAMVFPVVMYGCESWTVKKAEHQRIDAFELWCWRRLLRVPWTARRSNQSILKISPGCSLEGMMLKLKLQYFGHLMWRVGSLEKTLMLGGTGGRWRRGQQRMRWHHWLYGREFEWTPGVGGMACCNSWCCKESDTTERLNWTELSVDHWGRLAYLSLLFFGALHSNGCIFPFLLCLSLFFFSQLFVRPPQTTILPFCISFSWGWSWSLPPV